MVVGILSGNLVYGKFSKNRGLVYGILGAKGYMKLQNYSGITFKINIYECSGHGGGLA